MYKFKEKYLIEFNYITCFLLYIECFCSGDCGEDRAKVTLDQEPPEREDVPGDQVGERGGD